MHVDPHEYEDNIVYLHVRYNMVIFSQGEKKRNKKRYNILIFKIQVYRLSNKKLKT